MKDKELTNRLFDEVRNRASKPNPTDILLEDISERLDDIYKLIKKIEQELSILYIKELKEVIK